MSIQTVVSNASKHEIVIQAGGSTKTYWGDLWRYRELLFFLAWRDILVQYKQTVIGVMWALIRPTLPLVIFTFVFGNIAGLPSGDQPYVILVFSGLLPWLLFAGALSDVANSIVSNGNLISKIYFPRLLIPFSSLARSVIDFLIASIMLALLMAWFGVVPDERVLAFPLFILLGLVCALGIGLWMAALNIKYRDFRFIVAFVLQFGLYASPIGFANSVVPEQWRLLYALNPMVGVINGCRWSLLGGDNSLYLPGLLVSVGFAVLSLLTGLAYFLKTERSFADVI